VGAVDFSIDADLIAHLRTTLPFEVFVETGTFEGEAVARMLPFFEEIHTIELSDEYFARAANRFRRDGAVDLHHGDSAYELRSLRPRLQNRSVLYWLDAHWCVADGTAGESWQCPLLDELAALEKLNDRSVVLIDDARLFLSPPPSSHEVSDWPSFQQVLQALLRLSEGHEIVVVNDVIVFFPGYVTASIVEYAHAKSIDLLATVNRIETLERERALLEVVLEERLTAINDLTRAAEERLAIIEVMEAALAAFESSRERGLDTH